MSQTAQIIQLIASDREFTGYFCAALIKTYQEVPAGADRNAKLLELFASYVERLSADGLPKMVTANWLDFATTVIECLPERERGMVWDWLSEPANEHVMVDLKRFLEPNLATLKYGYEKMQNGGVPPLMKVPA